MRLLIGSDYHCSLQLQQQALDLIPTVDAYINCGDFCCKAGAQPETKQLGYHPAGKAEIDQLHHFFSQVDQLGKPWLFIPGNHDPAAEYLKIGSQPWSTSITHSHLITFLGLETLIIPWTPPCGWNWTLTSTHLKELIATYQNAIVDLIITHAPPRGVLDEKTKWYHRNTPTLQPLVQCLEPRYYFCGHMHLDGGKIETHDRTTFVNAACHNMILELDR